MTRSKVALIIEELLYDAGECCGCAFNHVDRAAYIDRILDTFDERQSQHEEALKLTQSSALHQSAEAGRIEAAARARFNHAAKTDGAWELLSEPQRTFHRARMRAALAAMAAVR